MVTLRPYQTDAVRAIYGAFHGGARRVLLSLPTGGGKTVILAHVIARSTARVLVLVHRRELLDQCSRTLSALGVDHATLCAGGDVDTDARVIVASVQTYVRRMGSSWAPERIVIDEGHHAVAGTWSRILGAHPDARVLGVTATPVRLGGQGLGDVYDALVEGPTVADLMRDGHLSRADVYSLPVLADLGRLRTRAGDYVASDVAGEFDRPTITGDAVATYERVCPGAPAIAFCASVSHAQHVAEAFRAAGYQAESVDGTLDADTRRDRIAALGDGRLHVLTSCDIVSEGTDVPIVTAAILLRPTQSLGLYLQQVGRVLRPAPGKHRAIILDHVGNVLRHGLPDEVRTWSLDGDAAAATSKRTLGPPPPVTCEGCYLQTPRPLPPSCANCGRAFTPTQRDYREVDGELVPVDVRDLAAYRERVERERQRRQRAEEAACDTLAELQELGRQRGYAPGWARARFLARMKRRVA